MQVAARPASISRGACALAAVTVAAEKARAASCKALEKQVCEARKLVPNHPIVRFEAAQQARFIGSDTPRGSNLLAKQASFLAWYLLFSAKQQSGSSGCLHKE